MRTPETLFISIDNLWDLVYPNYNNSGASRSYDPSSLFFYPSNIKTLELSLSQSSSVPAASKLMVTY